MTAAHESTIKARHAKLEQLLRASGLEALVLNPGPSLFYLTGLRFHLSERPVVFIFLPEGAPVVVLPELEAGKLQDFPFQVRAFAYGEELESWQAAFHQAAQLAQIEDEQVGVEPRRLRVLELRLLETAAPKARFQSAEGSLASLRMQKDGTEVTTIRRAVDIAQQALQATRSQIKPGMTERQLANELTLQLLHHGSESEMPFAPIVASGPNSANPHATPSERQLSLEDLLILDWGARANGYASDITRTFSLGEPDPELARVSEVVLEANTAARKKAAPGVSAGEVDQAARKVIEEAGYGRYFIHRTGHGLGLESHEEPYIRAGNPLTLADGMIFTIEPGIYIPGRGGVRIEDDFLVTADGGESLSDLTRELIVI